VPDARIDTQAVVAWLRGGGLSAVARAVSVFVAVLSVGLILASFVWPEPAAPDLSSQRLLPSGAPRKLVVKEKGVSAEVVPIAVKDGILDPPQDFREVGWWEGSSIAGPSGLTVITGHTVHTGDGAMDLIPDLGENHEVDIVTDKQVLVYVVTHKETLTRDQVAKQSKDLFSPGPDNLMLITCTDYNGTDYTENIIVWAQLVSSHPL
jgi:hypothetical protein